MCQNNYTKWFVNLWFQKVKVSYCVHNFVSCFQYKLNNQKHESFQMHYSLKYSFLHYNCMRQNQGYRLGYHISTLAMKCIPQRQNAEGCELWKWKGDGNSLHPKPQAKYEKFWTFSTRNRRKLFSQIMPEASNCLLVGCTFTYRDNRLRRLLFTF